MSTEGTNNNLTENTNDEIASTPILMVHLVDGTVYTFPYSSVDLAIENAEILIQAFEDDELFREVTVSSVDIDLDVLDVFAVKH